MTHAIRTRLPPGRAPRVDDRPWRPEHGLVPAPWVESAEADGCSCCTVGMLAGFARAVWREDEALLSRAGFTAMKTPWPPDEGFAYGYGLELDPRGFGQGGDMLGHVSYVRVDIEAGLGVVCWRGRSWFESHPIRDPSGEGVPSSGVPGSLSSRQPNAGDDVLSNANLTVT